MAKPLLSYGVIIAISETTPGLVRITDGVFTVSAHAGSQKVRIGQAYDVTKQGSLYQLGAERKFSG